MKNELIEDVPPLLPDPVLFEQIHRNIAPNIHRTPLMTCSTIDAMLGCRLIFKCENFQKAGAFKSRGAVNAVSSLPPDALTRGVCTHSSGNHAQALARAASLVGCQAWIVMPDNAPSIKTDAVRQYGGRITFCKPTLKAREETLLKVMEETGAIEIHPYNNPWVILGQATCSKEVFEDTDRDIDIIITPVGGGGLLSGTCLGTACWSPGTLVMAAEPEGANDAWQSLTSGTLVPSRDPNTIADGLLTSLGSHTWPIIRDHVKNILLTDDDFIIKAMKLIWERMKIIVEPSAAVPLAALLKKHAEKEFGFFSGKSIALVLSGGNIDLNNLPW